MKYPVRLALCICAALALVAVAPALGLLVLEWLARLTMRY